MINTPRYLDKTIPMESLSLRDAIRRDIAVKTRETYNAPPDMRSVALHGLEPNRERARVFPDAVDAMASAALAEKMAKPFYTAESLESARKKYSPS